MTTQDPGIRNALRVMVVALVLLTIGTAGKLLCMAGIIHVWCT